MVSGAQVATPTRSSSVGSESVIFVIIQNIIGWILAAVGILGVVGLAIAGILWLSAAGELDRISKAKDILVRSLIGTVISVLGLIIFNFIQMYIR